MGSILKMALGAVGLAGGGIPVGWLMVGAVVGVLTILGGTWKAGYNYRGTLDELAMAQVENDRLKEQQEETLRQLDSVNQIQQADTDRAARLQERVNQLESSNVTIQCDPPAPVTDQLRDATERVPLPKAKHPTSPVGRGTLRGGPNIAPGSLKPDGGKPSVECRPGFAC